MDVIKIMQMCKSHYVRVTTVTSKNPELILSTSLMGLGGSGYFTSSTSLLIDFLNHLGEISIVLSFLELDEVQTFSGSAESCTD